MFRLDGRIALVTGASQGIGRSVAMLLALQGAKVVAAARNEEKLADLCREIVEAGGEAIALPLDLSKPEEVATQIAGLPDEFREIGILVNNAGITDDTLLARMKLEQWERVLGTNLTGAFAVTKAVLRGMVRQRWGRIISVSSVVGMMGNPGQANYAASKAGLIGFSKSVAKEIGSRSITCNVVAPGFIETAMTADLPEKGRKDLEAGIALRRLGSVDDIAAAVLYLASDAGAYVTGHVLNVSGGLYI